MSTESLRSTSYIRALDLVSEGPIEGLVDGLRSVFLDDTRLQNADGSFNFEGFTVIDRKGEANQEPIDGFSAVESITTVGVQVKQATPVVRTITNPNVDAVLVTIGVPALQTTDEATGTISGALVRMTLEVQPNGGSWISAAADTAIGELDKPSIDPAYAQVPANVIATRIDPRVRISNATLPGAYEYRVEYRPTTEAPVDVGGGWIVGRQALMEVSTATTIIGSEGDGGTGTLTVYSASETFELRAPGGGPLPRGRYDLRVTLLTGPAPGGTIEVGGLYYESLPAIRISGKTSSRYQRQYRVPLPAGGAPWSIRLTRTTPDSGSVYVQNETWWDSYTEVIQEKLRYPFSALIATSIDASQFNRVPTRAYDVRLRKVKVPVNYDPIARTYTGSWDGTFKVAWTDNPAWCFHDLLTHPRYGLGAFVGMAVDKWTLYSIGRYCDELVPNGLGGQEPRFTCNLWIATKAEAFRVLNDMASIFRGLLYWADGSVTAAQDAPSDPVALFTPANVVDGQFTYSGSSAKVRHTAALVTWNDPLDLCRQKVEYVEDREGIERYGLVMTEVAAVGCTSRGQANRVGRWLLFSERLQTDAVAFKVGLEGAVVRPGNVIKVADPGRAGVRFGGRLLAATTTALTLDAPVTLAAGQTYTLSCLRADGTVQERTVTTAAGTTASLTVSPALAEAPAVGSIWVLQSSAVEAQLFRVLTVSEAERSQFEISAIVHEPAKYALIENGVKLPARSISVLRTVPLPPDAIAVAESLYPIPGGLAVRLDISWTRPASANRFAVTWRRLGGSAEPEREVLEPGIEILGAAGGESYEISVYSVSPLGLRSATARTRTYFVLGKQARPANVEGFVVLRSGPTLSFTWRPIADLDAARYEIRRGGSWETAVIVASATHPTNAAEASSPRGGTYLIKAFDTSGNESLVARAVVVEDASDINVVLEVADGLNGELDGTIPYEVLGTPTWDGTTSWDDGLTWATFGALRGITLPLGVPSGFYESEVVDIGYSTAALLSINPEVRVLGSLSSTWDTYTQPWTAYSGPAWVWQPAPDAVSVSYEISTSEDGTTWTPWALFTPGTYRLRFLKMRVRLATIQEFFRPLLTRLAFVIDVPDRVERLPDVAVPIEGATINFAPAFIGVSTVQATLQSATVGDTYTVTDKSPTSVTVRVYDSAGAPKAGLLDIDVYGYGERL